MRRKRCTARTHHSAQSLHAINKTTLCRVDYKQIKWPSAKCKNDWHQFDEDISEIIWTTSKGNTDEWLKILPTIIVSYAKERFGLHESGKEKTYCKNHKAKKIQDLWDELRALKKKYKQAGEGEGWPLTELREILRTKLRYLRKAEWHRRCWKERARTSFLADPFDFAKKLLGDKRNGQLNCRRHEHLSQRYFEWPRQEQGTRPSGNYY